MQASISFAKETKKTSIKHNNRDFDEKDWDNKYHEHIDRERIKSNVTLVKENIREKYDELFGKSVVEYNAKQKRADRKIDDFYAKVQKDKKLELQREFVIQIGDLDMYRMEDDEGFSTWLNDEQVADNWRVANEILERYVEGFKERNPNLVIYNAVIHNDEASPHLHLNIIPVAEGYQRGIQKQPSFNKALKQQGIEFEASNNRSLWNNFRKQEVEAVEDLMLQHDWERKLVGTNRIKDMHQYKEAWEEIREVSKYRNKLDKEADELYSDVAKLNRDVEGLAKIRSELRGEAFERAKVVKGLREEKGVLDGENERLRGIVENNKVVISEQAGKYKMEKKMYSSIRKHYFDISKIKVVDDTEEKREGLKKIRVKTGWKLIKNDDWQEVKALAITGEAFHEENQTIQTENLRLTKENERLAKELEQEKSKLEHANVLSRVRLREVETLEKENSSLKKTVENLKGTMDQLKKDFEKFTKDFGLVDRFKEFANNLRKEREQKELQKKQLEEQRRRDVWERNRDSGGFEL